MTLIEVLVVAVLLGLIAMATLTTSRRTPGETTARSLQSLEWSLRDIARQQGGITLTRSTDGRWLAYHDELQLSNIIAWSQDITCEDDAGNPIDSLYIDRRGFSINHTIASGKTQEGSSYHIDGYSGNIIPETHASTTSNDGRR
jgi:type II secretory pathway pseudopilin PulG